MKFNKNFGERESDLLCSCYLFPEQQQQKLWQEHVESNEDAFLYNYSLLPHSADQEWKTLCMYEDKLSAHTNRKV